MAVREITVTTTPTAVARLAESQRYVIQNQSNEPVYSDTASAVPADSSAPGIRIPPQSIKLDDQDLKLHYIELSAGQLLYLWTRSGTGKVVLTEAIS